MVERDALQGAELGASAAGSSLHSAHQLRRAREARLARPPAAGEAGERRLIVCAELDCLRRCAIDPRLLSLSTTVSDAVLALHGFDEHQPPHRQVTQARQYFDKRHPRLPATLLNTHSLCAPGATPAMCRDSRACGRLKRFGLMVASTCAQECKARQQAAAGSRA